MLFTFPSRYWFTIGLSRVFSLTGWSRLIHAEFLVLRATQDTTRLQMTTRTGLSPSTGRISIRFRSPFFLPHRGPTTPSRPEPRWFGLFRVRSPLLAESFLYFLFLRVLRCFSSPRSPPSFNGCRVCNPAGCPIRKSADQRIFAPNRSLSQLITSFFACESLGIRHTPFPTFARLLSSIIHY